MNDVPIAHAMPALPEWQLQIAWAVLSLIALGTFATLLWRMVRAYQVRRTLRCPVKEQDADVTLRLEPATGAPAEVTRCSLLHPAHDVGCSQSCLHPPRELHPHLRA